MTPYFFDHRLWGLGSGQVVQQSVSNFSLFMVPHKEGISEQVDPYLTDAGL